MSRTTIIGIWHGEKIESLEELANSWGSAPPVWEAMAERYLNCRDSYNVPGTGWMQLGDKLWDLAKRKDIPMEHRAVFMLTFDRAYVAKKNYPRMVEAIDQFLKDFPPKAGTVNHWRRIIGVLHIHDGRDSSNAPGIGLYCSSVSENPFVGPWNEEKKENDEPDWKNIYEIFEVLEQP